MILLADPTTYESDESNHHENACQNLSELLHDKSPFKR
jgi:hypothetical protein